MVTLRDNDNKLGRFRFDFSEKDASEARGRERDEL